MRKFKDLLSCECCDGPIEKKEFPKLKILNYYAKNSEINKIVNKVIHNGILLECHNCKYKYFDVNKVDAQYYALLEKYFSHYFPKIRYEWKLISKLQSTLPKDDILFLMSGKSSHLDIHKTLYDDLSVETNLPSFLISIIAFAVNKSCGSSILQTLSAGII